MGFWRNAKILIKEDLEKVIRGIEILFNDSYDDVKRFFKFLESVPTRIEIGNWFHKEFHKVKEEVKSEIDQIESKIDHTYNELKNDVEKEISNIKNDIRKLNVREIIEERLAKVNTDINMISENVEKLTNDIHNITHQFDQKVLEALKSNSKELEPIIQAIVDIMLQNVYNKIDELAKIVEEIKAIQQQAESSNKPSNKKPKK